VPVLTADDTHLTKEPSLLGIAFVKLQDMLMNAALGEELRKPLTYPQARVEGVGGGTSPEQVASDWYKTKRLGDKSSAVSLGVQIFHCRPQGVDGNANKGETPVPGSLCSIADVSMREADLVGHEVTFFLAASNLLKFDWASRSDPMCALFEKVYHPRTPCPRFTQDDCGLGDFLDEVNTLSRCGVPPTQVSQVAQLMGANGLVLVQHLRGIAPDLMEALGMPLTLVRAAGDALERPPAASDNRPEWEWCLLAQTEWQVNTHNPSFERHLSMYYDPARDKELRFAVYNVTSPSVLEQDVIGSVEVRLSDLVQAADGRPLELKLHSEKRDVAEQLARKGTTLSITTSLELVMRGEGAAKGREHHIPPVGTQLNYDAIARPMPTINANHTAHELVLTVGVHSLPKVQWGGKCNPVLLLLSQYQSGDHAFNQLVSRTDWRSNTHDTVFARSLVLPLDAQWSRLYRLALFDVGGERLGPDDLVGYVEFTLQQLAEVALPYKDESPVDLTHIGRGVRPPLDWHFRFGLNSPEAALQTAFAHKLSSLTFFVEQRKLRPTADVLHLFG
jgi:hypothetical protein